MGITNTGVVRKEKILMTEDFYSLEYFAGINRIEADQAAKLAEWAIENLWPSRVVDFGAATGLYLEPFKRIYTPRKVDILGLELSNNAFDPKVARAPGYVLKHDITLPVGPETERFDLALCIEVLEHIPEEFTDQVIRNICAAGLTVIISAAVPGQGGEHHHNEQPHQYWIDKFTAHGKKLNEPLTRSLIDKLNGGWAMPWIGNFMVFF